MTARNDTVSGTPSRTRTWLTLVPVLLLCLIVLPSAGLSQLASRDWGQSINGLRIHPKATWLDDLPLGPFGRLDENTLITVEDAPDARHALISKDDGKTWEKASIFAEPEKFREAFIRATPLRRFARPEEIADAILYLASDRASFVTGQVLSVSGGLTMAD